MELDELYRKRDMNSLTTVEQLYIILSKMLGIYNSLTSCCKLIYIINNKHIQDLNYLSLDLLQIKKKKSCSKFNI